MKKYRGQLAGLLMLGVISCTSLSEGGGADMEARPERNRRVQHQTGSNMDQLQRGMDRQSSEINRKRNIEEAGTNGPATTPPRQRPARAPNAPVDSTRHNVTWPMPTTVPR